MTPRQLKDDRAESRLIRRRLLWGSVIVVLGILALGGRYAWLQLLHYDDYIAQSERNRVKLQPVPPNRGLIYDRNGVLLAENRPAYRLEVVPERVEDMAAVLDTIDARIGISETERERFGRERQQRRAFEGVPLKLNLSPGELATIAVDLHQMPGVQMVPYLTRRYPYADLYAHVLGYVGRLDVEDLRRLDRENYLGSTYTGKTGLELQYEAALHGRTGFQQVESNAQGRTLRVLERQRPEPGADLVLTIDHRLQQAAWDALGDRAGAIVAIDPRNGEVLALVSKPAFDTNLFVNGLSQAQYDAILNGRGQPLINRALRGAYEPGSTLKPFVGLAGLELGVVEPDSRVFSSGQFRIPGQQRPYRDWRRGGHGWVDVLAALEESVNTYFYQLALDLGIDRFHDYLSQFGFGQPTGIDLPSESAGVLPSREWKRGRFSEPWYPGETVIAGIGQGFNVVTPLQLAVATAALTTTGQRRVPHVVRASRVPGNALLEVTAEPQPIPVKNPRNWALIREGMRRVVHGEKGTARAIADGLEYEMAGKSGTAQVYGLAEGETYDEEEVAENLRTHALFVGFAPLEDPEIAVAVVVEHGGGGSTVAAPVLRQVLDAWIRPAQNDGTLPDSGVAQE